MHNHFSGLKKSLPLAGIRCRTAGGSASIKKGSTANTALLVWVDSYRPFGSMLEQSTSLFKSLDSGSWHNLTSPETSPFSQVIPVLPKYKTAITAIIHISVFNILRDLLFGYQSFGFFRCSAMSLRPQASSTQAEKLDKGFSSFSRSTLASILSMSSCGKRIPFVVERLFLKPVAMPFPLCWCRNTIQVKNGNKSVDVYMHIDIWCLCTLVLKMVQIAKPGSVGTLTGPLTTNDSQRIEVAMRDITTAPQRFTFLFLAVVRANPQDLPHREQVTATSEREARSFLAGRFVLVFAGRLPVRAVRHA